MSLERTLDIYHPAVPCVYFVSAVLITMLAFHPVITLLSLVFSLITYACLRGVRTCARSLLWICPLVLLIACANALFSQNGVTELARLGEYVVYAESCAYGLCMGAMLVAVIMWFACATCVLSSGKIMALLSRRLPTISFMMSYILRLVPLFAARGAHIARVQKVCTPAGSNATPARTNAVSVQVAAAQLGSVCSTAVHPVPLHKSARLHIREGARILSVLMGWSMEDSLESADAMRARGWGVSARRTRYIRCRFRLRDSVALVCVCALAMLSIVLSVVATSQFQFYPHMSVLLLWWGYVVIAFFFSLPVILEVEGRFL